MADFDHITVNRANKGDLDTEAPVGEFPNRAAKGDKLVSPSAPRIDASFKAFDDMKALENAQRRAPSYKSIKPYAMEKHAPASPPHTVGKPAFSPFATPEQQAEIDKLILDKAGGDPVKAQNLSAFTKTIAWSEGTLVDGKIAYNLGVTNKQYHSYDKHPHEHVRVAQYGKKSDAFGFAQFMGKTWEEQKAKLGLKNIDPVSQMKAALNLIEERGAMPDVLNGKFRSAVNKTAWEWASFPGNNYGQATRAMDDLEGKFVEFKGAPTDNGFFAKLARLPSHFTPQRVPPDDPFGPPPGQAAPAPEAAQAAPHAPSKAAAHAAPAAHATHAAAPAAHATHHARGSAPTHSHRHAHRRYAGELKEHHSRHHHHQDLTSDAKPVHHAAPKHAAAPKTVGPSAQNPVSKFLHNFGLTS